MEITVSTYDHSLQNAWDIFVSRDSRNGCMFHEQKFLAYHPAERFIDVSLVFLEQGAIVGVLPAALIDSSGHKSVVSHPGSSAGGLVFHRKHGLRAVLEMLEKAIEYFRMMGFHSLEMRIAEPIFSEPPDGELIYLLWHRGFRLATREISSCVNLRAGEWVSFGRKKNGNDIRRLERLGVVAARIDTPDEIYPLIMNNLGNRHGKQPTHSLAELCDLKKRYPERVDFWVVRYDGVAVATIVLFAVNDRVIHDFYIAQDYEYAQLQVMPLLFYIVFDYYRDKGFDWFNFGISSRGDWIKWGILEFKERMGARATTRDIWRLDDLYSYKCHKDTEE